MRGSKDFDLLFVKKFYVAIIICILAYLEFLDRPIPTSLTNAVTSIIIVSVLDGADKLY